MPTADDENTETPLDGGNITAVVRVGNTVRRSAGTWTPAVHALLDNLEAAGFEAAPRARGLDEQGREVLTFIDGEPGQYPMPVYVWSDTTLADVGRLLRRYHDLTVGFATPADPRWRSYAGDAGQVEVICHSDWGPYNAIFRDERLYAMVDWDFARPGSRLSDLAYAAYTWIPIQRPHDFAFPGTPDAADQGRRLRLLCDAYGLADRSGVLPALIDRVDGLADWMEAMAADGHAAFQKMVDGGGPARHRGIARYLDAERVALGQELV